MKTQPYQPSRVTQELLFSDEVLLSKGGETARLLPAIALLYVSSLIQAGVEFTLTQLDGTLLAKSSGDAVTAVPQISVALDGVRKYLDDFALFLEEEIRKDIASRTPLTPEASPAAGVPVQEELAPGPDRQGSAP